jgi:hypothetical protein
LAAIAAPIVPRPTKPMRSTTTSHAVSGWGDPGPGGDRSYPVGGLAGGATRAALRDTTWCRRR